MRIKSAIQLGLLFGLFLLSNGGSIGAQTALIKGIDDTGPRLLFDHAAFDNKESTVLPQWSNGYLVSHDVESFNSDSSNVRLYDHSGKLARQSTIWFPDSKRVLVYAAIAGANGNIIAAGKAEKNDGTAAPFILSTDLAGNIVQVIQTEGFFAVAVCEAPDGTIWGFGGTGHTQNTGPKPGNTIHQYDFTKGELASYLPRSYFARVPGPEAFSYINCLPGGLAVYSGKAGKYIEMNYKNDTPHIFAATVPPNFTMRGFTMAGARLAYGHFSKAGVHGLYVLTFDETLQKATWMPIESTVGLYTDNGVVTGLWGVDGDKLVVSMARDASGEMALHWVTPIAH